MQQKSKRGRAARGYRIDFASKHDPYHYQKLPIIWRLEQDGIPPIWQHLKDDPNVVKARLFKSGRQIDRIRR